MNTEAFERLKEISSSDDFLNQAANPTDQWSKASDGFNAVEAVLRFMEANRSLDLGTPGPLVHFVEGFYGKGYEAKLFESLHRRPTKHTVWMLSRVVNGTKDTQDRERLIGLLRKADSHPLAD